MTLKDSNKKEAKGLINGALESPGLSYLGIDYGQLKIVEADPSVKQDKTN